MKSVRVFLLGVVCLVMTGSIAEAQFYVIASGRGAGTEIKALPYTISQPGFYYITQDLSSAENGIIVDAANVTIDLMGFSLVGSGTGGYVGVWISGLIGNVEVRNGTITNFDGMGIYGDLGEIARNNRAINIRAIENGGMGINLLGTGNKILNCTSNENGGHGIHAGMGSLVQGNVACKNDEDGIRVARGSNVIGNTAFRNDHHGIFAWSNSLIAHNTAYDNSQGTGGPYPNYLCDGGNCLASWNYAP
jgi:parallel beta-helix repeat protein